MEQRLKCVLLLSLREMSLRTLVASSLSSSGVLASVWRLRIRSFYMEESRKEWRESVEDTAKDKISQLGLPTLLLKPALDLVPPMGLELRRWKLLHDERKYPHDDILLSTKLFWTSVGTIDDRKTAENIVLSDTVDVERRYQIACENCLEDSIPFLWMDLPDERKVHYSTSTKSRFPHMSFVWPLIMSGELSSLIHLLGEEADRVVSFNQWAFECAAHRANTTAAKYFFPKLTPREREASFMRSADTLFSLIYSLREQDRVVLLLDFASYLLTLMTPEEQMRKLREYPITILFLFLRWPLTDLFEENVSLVWASIRVYPFRSLALIISGRFRMSGHYFPQLFQEFYIKSPLEFKRIFLGFPSYLLLFPGRDTPWISFLTLFLESSDSESIEVVFRSVDPDYRHILVFQPDLLPAFYDSVMKGRWHLVEKCLREATLFEGLRMLWKEYFMAFVARSVSEEIEWNDPRWKGFFDFFDEGKKGQKRKLVELS